MHIAEIVTLLFAGGFLLAGLLTGTWKYIAIARSDAATAPVYVDVAHRASLMYAFASLVVLAFVERSPLPDPWRLICALAPQVFFALAIGTYVVHGILRDTDNQLRVPHVLGRITLPRWMVGGFMVSLIAAELGGFAVLFGSVAIELLAG